ncbi:MAG: hypothetical protein ACERKD_21095 [Prolixibacteraceae bacterium]
MKIFHLFFVSLLAVFVAGCSKEEAIDISAEKQICREYTEVYSYEGTLYYFDFTEYSDESIDFIGDTLSPGFKIISEVMQGQSLSILTFTDSEITYLFDNPNLKEKYLSTVRQPLKRDLKSATTWHSLYVRCFLNVGFNYMLFDAADPENGLIPTHYNSGNWDGFPNLTYVNGNNFDDRMSSIQILNYSGMEAEIALWADPSFSGYNWTIYCRPSSVNLVGDSNQDDGYKGNDISQLVDFTNRVMYSTGILWWKKNVSWDNQVTSIQWRTIECVGECSGY